ARNGHQYIISGIDERSRQYRERSFASDRVDHLSLGIDPLDGAYALQIASGSLLQDCVTVISIAAVFRLARFSAKFFHHFWKGHFVRFADAQINDLRAGMKRHGSPLGALDLFKLIDCLRLAVLAAANPLSE